MLCVLCVGECVLCVCECLCLCVCVFLFVFVCVCVCVCVGFVLCLSVLCVLGR